MQEIPYNPKHVVMTLLHVEVNCIFVYWLQDLTYSYIDFTENSFKNFRLWCGYKAEKEGNEV